MNTSYARTTFKCYHRRLIRSYNITMGHHLLGLVCTVDSSTFHWSLNSPRVVRKGVWFIVDHIKSRWRAFSWQKKVKAHWTQGLDQNTPDRDRQAEEERKYEPNIGVSSDKETHPLNLHVYNIQNQNPGYLSFYIFSWFSFWAFCSVGDYTLSNQEAPTRDSSGGVREKLKYCKKYQKWLLKQARKCMCHCVGHLLRWPITSARGHGWTDLSGLNLSIKNTLEHILLVGIILIAVRNPNIWEKKISLFTSTHIWMMGSPEFSGWLLCPSNIAS